MRRFVVGLSMPVIVALLLIFVAPPYAHCMTATKNPNDVYSQVMILRDQVIALRKNSGVKDKFPSIKKQECKAPRHVLQKAMEVLDKINRLRRIRNMGAITVPPYPSREISPNEVYGMVRRLVGEMQLFLPGDKPAAPKTFSGKTPNDVYRELWGISRALDPVLGIRGLMPADVYNKSLEALETIRFLRLSQNKPYIHIKKPERTEGNHPNHSLKMVYNLLGKIAVAERNLWIEPITLPKVSMRVIEPQEVYDALNIVIAELQRIKYRLGLERYIKTPETQGEKTPDDVVQILKYAIATMPDFSNKPLIQYNPAHLAKTPDHVFAVAEHILEELKAYKNYRGIKAPSRKPPEQVGLEPQHVFGKTLENLDKVSRLRRQVGFGELVVPEFPLRRVTPTEVYDMAIRLDAEIGIIYDAVGMSSVLFYETVGQPEFTGKTSSDVFEKMWEISFLLDTIIGSEGYTPSDVYVQALQVVSEIELIAKRVKKGIQKIEPPLSKGKRPSDVIVMARNVRKLLKMAKKHAGMFEPAAIQEPTSIVSGRISPDDVFNEVGLIFAEIVELKIHLGIAETTKLPIKAEGKTPSDVYQQLESAQAMLEGILDI